MMIGDRKWLLSFLVLTVCGVFRDVSPLKCFECTESEPNICGENFDRSKVNATDCEASIYTVGTSTNQEKVYACMFLNETNIDNGKSKYTRRCSVKNLNDTCESIVATNQARIQNIRTNCYQCENNLCNSSTSLDIRFSILVIFVCLVIFRT